MPLTQGLPLSRLVSVSVSLTTQAIVAESVNSLLILGTSPVITPAERVRQYASITEVAADFGTSCEEYYAANLWFSQNPSPNNIFIGRWAKTAVGGALIGAPLTVAQQQMANWTGITTGAFGIQIDGAATPTQITALSFAGQTTLNGVASIIQTALAVGHPGITCVWNQNQDTFIITSGTTGPTSSISFLTSPTGGGQDISGQLGMRSNSSGAFTSPGQAAETKALTAAIQCDLLFSTQWYGLICPSATFGATGDHLDLAGYCEASGIGAGPNPHYYGISTSEGAALLNVTLDSQQTTPSIAYYCYHYGYNKTAVQYTTNVLADGKAYAIASYLARILTTPWTGQNTTLTLMYKQEPGVPPENISTTQADNLLAKCCNVYCNYANGARLVEYGMSASGQFTDTIIGADSLALDLQAAIFNVLYTTPTKIPQTDPGMQLLVNAAEATCSQYTANGWLGTGTWNAQGFGTLYTGKVLEEGWYVYAPSMLTQAQGDRAARRAPLIQVAAKTAGAIHSSTVIIYVNQ